MCQELSPGEALSSVGWGGRKGARALHIGIHDPGNMGPPVFQVRLTGIYMYVTVGRGMVGVTNTGLPIHIYI